MLGDEAAAGMAGEGNLKRKTLRKQGKSKELKGQRLEPQLGPDQRTAEGHGKGWGCHSSLKQWESTKDWMPLIKR